MTDEAKALTRRTAVSAQAILLAPMAFRALAPWALVTVVACWIRKAVSQSSWT